MSRFYVPPLTRWPNLVCHYSTALLQADAIIADVDNRCPNKLCKHGLCFDLSIGCAFEIMAPAICTGILFACAYSLTVPSKVEACRRCSSQYCCFAVSLTWYFPTVKNTDDAKRKPGILEVDSRMLTPPLRGGEHHYYPIGTVPVALSCHQCSSLKWCRSPC